MGHIGDGFYGLNVPTDNVKALEEDKVLRIRRLKIIQHTCSIKINTKYTNINTSKSTHNEMSPVRQNPIQRTVRTAHLGGLSVLMTVHNFSTQYNIEQF